MSCYITDIPVTEDGEYTLTHPNGKLHSKIFIKDGLLHGKKTEYDIQGNLVAEFTYKNGKLDGITKVYYPNGKKFVIKHYRKNKLHGYYTQYNESGKEVCKFVYNGNKIIKEYN